MGLGDRDYMHERRDPPLTPPADVGVGTFLAVLLVCALVFGGYKAYGWYLERQAMDQHKPTPMDPAPLKVNPPVVARPETAPQRPKAWMRCMVNGKVLYSDNGCPGTDQGRPNRSDQASAEALGTSRSTTQVLYHCKAYSGGTFWASSHCNQHQALVDRMVTVPAQLPFDQQVALAEDQRQAARRLQSPAPTAVTGAPTNSDRSIECTRLDQQIRHWDGMARQPQSASTQDWIREKRRKARDRQFELHC